MLIEPTHIPELSTLGDIWDEEQDNIITINELRHRFPLHGNRKINAFHKMINKLKEKIIQLFHNAPTDLPLPLIIKSFSNHYLINENNDIYATSIDPHTQAHTIKYKMHCLALTDLKPYKLFHTYMIKNKVFGTQFIKQSPIEHHNLDKSSMV